MYWCVHEGWDQGSPAGSFSFLSCWHPENVICSGWSEAHRQLPSEGRTSISVLIGLGLLLFDLKVEQKLFLNAKNSSGGRLFSDLKLRLLYYKPFRDLNRKRYTSPLPDYFTCPYLPSYYGFWLFCWLTAIWVKSEFDSATLDLYFVFLYHFDVWGRITLSHTLLSEI